MGQRKIPLVTGVFMTGFTFALEGIAALLDLFLFGLAGVLLDGFLTLLYSLWLPRYDVSLWAWKRLGGTALAILVQFIPEIGDFTFPWTFRIAAIVITERYPMPEQTEVPERQLSYSLLPERLSPEAADEDENDEE